MSDTKNNNEKPFNLHVMPPCITDEDISALFNGILNLVKKKFELEKNAETVNLNININSLMRQLKEKQAEIIRLKNEVISLKSQLSKQSNCDNL